jgi:hypothetical protein
MTDEAHDYQNGSDSDLGQNSEIARAEETHR